MPIGTPTGYLDITNATLRGSQIVTTGYVGIANANPVNHLSVGSNLHINDTHSNVLQISGNINAAGVVLGGISIAPTFDLEIVTNTGNTTPYTVEFNNTATAFVTTANATIGDTLTASKLVGDGSAISAIQSSNVSDFASNVTRIATLETDLDSNVTRIQTLETDLDSNVTRIQTLETDLDSNVTRIQTLETDLDSNVTRIQTLETDLDSNVTRIQTLETANMTIDGEKTFSSNFEVGTADLFVDTTTGRVGVGTDSPDSKLHIYLDSETGTSNTVGLTITNASSDYTSVTNGFGSRILFRTNRGGTSATNTDKSAEIKGYIYTGAGGTGDYHALDLDVYGDNASLNKGISIQSMSATGDPADTIVHGNLGIGTNSPKEILDVRGPAVHPVVSYASGQDAPYLIAAGTTYDGTSTNWATEGIQHRIKTSSGGVPRVTIDTPQSGEVFCVTNNGNVGIGTNNPGRSLEVYTGDGAIPGLRLRRYPTGATYTDLQHADPTSPANSAEGLAITTSDGNATTREVMRICGNNRVGIGTNNPVCGLDVQNSGTRLSFPFGIGGTSIYAYKTDINVVVLPNNSTSWYRDIVSGAFERAGFIRVFSGASQSGNGNLQNPHEASFVFSIRGNTLNWSRTDGSTSISLSCPAYQTIRVSVSGGGSYTHGYIEAIMPNGGIAVF